MASFTIRAIGGAARHTLNSVGDLDENLARNLGSAVSKVNHLTGRARKNTGTEIENIFHGLLASISGTVKWAVIHYYFLDIYIYRHIFARAYNKHTKNYSQRQAGTPTTNPKLHKDTN